MGVVRACVRVAAGRQTLNPRGIDVDRAFGHLHAAFDQQIRLLGNEPLKNLAKYCFAKRIKPWLRSDAPRHLAPFRIHAKPGRLSSHG